jgi:radical SAM superfamily enzyme YgiQ (UPF0313 family)
MKEAGARRYLGLETGSDETLRLMNKRLLEDGVRAVDVFRQAGVRVALFIVGYPGETTD